MLKSIKWKAIFKVFAWLVCLAGLVVLISFIEIKKQEVKCSKIEIVIPGADNFIEREEIDAILQRSSGNLIGRQLVSINLHQIEKTIKANPYIAFIKVYTEMDGVLNIEIKQRQPILRVLNSGGQDFYIDNEGLKIPVSSNFTANVLVATGNILEGFSGKVDTLLTPLAKNLYKTALFTKNDALWDAQFEQLYVNEKNDIEIIPRVGNQRIILGNADSLEVKMQNLLAFYKQAMPKVGWNIYKNINLKYTNQVVCEKYDSLTDIKAQTKAKDSVLIINTAGESVTKNPLNQEIKTATSNSKPKQVVSTDKPLVHQAHVKQINPIVKETKTVKSAIKPAAAANEKVSTKKTNNILNK